MYTSTSYQNSKPRRRNYRPLNDAQTTEVTLKDGFLSVTVTVDNSCRTGGYFRPTKISLSHGGGQIGPEIYNYRGRADVCAWGDLETGDLEDLLKLALKALGKANALSEGRQ